jgi:hypothetical protein
VEGTSGCHEPFSFTGRWSRQPWRLPHAGKRYGSQGPKLRRRREGAPGLAEEGEATEVSEARLVSRHKMAASRPGSRRASARPVPLGALPLDRPPPSPTGPQKSSPPWRIVDGRGAFARRSCGRPLTSGVRRESGRGIDEGRGRRGIAEVLVCAGATRRVQGLSWPSSFKKHPMTINNRPRTGADSGNPTV